MRLLRTRPLTCNPQRLPHELAGVYSDAIQARGNAKGTLCKGEITTAKSLSFSAPLCPPISLSLSVSVYLTHTQTHTERQKDCIGIEKGTMETRGRCSLNGKTLKEKTFIHLLPRAPLLHYAECLF